VSLQRVCVFCGSSHGSLPAYDDAAVSLGRTLARRRIGLVYGGGAIGLMGTLAEATMAAGGEVVGVVPRGLFGNEVARSSVTSLRHVGTMHERKALMYSLADAFSALPGGLGTLEELAETLTWAQIGLHDKPIGLLDVAGFFGPLRQFLEHAAREAFIKARHLDRLVIDDDDVALVDALAAEAARRRATTVEVDKL
jgi:uncharacterized protein (TIGR00730 family)